MGPNGAATNAWVKKRDPTEGILVLHPDLLWGASATTCSALIGGALKGCIKCQTLWADVKTLDPCGLGGVSINKGEREFYPLQIIYIEVSATSSYTRGIQLTFTLSEAFKLSPDDDDNDLREIERRAQD